MAQNAKSHALREEYFSCADLLNRRCLSNHTRCKECMEYKTVDEMAREKDGRIARHQRCQRCAYPFCAVCHRQRKESEGPVPESAKEKKSDEYYDEGVWFCEQKKCQAKKPKKCSACKVTKPSQEFASDGKNHHSRCLSCEYPTCATCGHTRPREGKAVEERHKDQNGKWYCQPACRPKSR